MTDSNGREFTSNGCGPSAALDQSLGTTWSTQAVGEKFLVLRLPEPIDVTQFALDPAEGCGDTAASATGAYLIETSPDGTAWSTAHQGVFTSAARHQLNFVTPTAGRGGRPLRAPDVAVVPGLRRPIPRPLRVRRLRHRGRSRHHRPGDHPRPGRPAVHVLVERAGDVRVPGRHGQCAACTSPHVVAVPDGAIRSPSARSMRRATATRRPRRGRSRSTRRRRRPGSSGRIRRSARTRRRRSPSTPRRPVRRSSAR